METTASPNGAPAGFHELPRRAFIATLAGLMLAMLLAALDQTIVGTAMPRVVAELGGFEHYTWVVTAYLVASTVCVPIFGKLSDLHGRKPYYLLGIGVFLIGSALCGAAADMTQLALFRGLQGLGAGIMQAIAFTVIADLFPPAQRGRAQGMFAAVFGFASIAGPTAGGYITDNLSWRWVFYVNLPLGLLAFAVLAVFFPSFRPSRVHGGIDYVGVVTLTLAVVPFLLALTWGGTQYAWTSPEEIGLFAIAAVFAAVFVWNERRVAEPIIPLSLFKNRIVAVSVLAVFLTAIGMFGSILFIPLFIQGVVGASATTSGNVLTPMMLSFIVGSIVSGQTMTRTGRYKVNAIVGTVLMAVGLYLLSTMSVETSFATAIAYMVTVGIGLGATMPVFTVAAQNAAPVAHLGAATSLFQFARSVGGAMGTAVLGSMLTNRFASTFKATLPTVLTPQQLQLLPPQLLQAFQNPQALFARQETGSAAQQAFAQFGPQGQAIAEGITQAVRLSLADAITATFLAGAVFGAIALAATLFLREAPLRQTNAPDKAEASGSIPIDQTGPLLRPSANGRESAPGAIGVEERRLRRD